MKQKLFLLAALVIAFAACNDNEPGETITHKSKIDGCLSGLFSISSTEQVYFSKGNLQWRKNGADDESGTWSFAVTQYSTVSKADNENLTDNFITMDLFGWNTVYNPTLTSNKIGDYDNEWHDWGRRPISNGGNKAYMWRTLTQEQWLYLFHGRTDAAKKLGVGHIHLYNANDSVNGIFILPDNWKQPSGIDFYSCADKGMKWMNGYYYFNSAGGNFNHNCYNLDEWEDMERAGAVFLPAAGARYQGPAVREIGTEGYYWSATAATEIMDKVNAVYFWDKSVCSHTDIWWYYGHSVRLVR
ncbi:MAG: hypothetical protein II827_02660 [Paludibacteraceae bacterium]|nr:hypothetical protein [Paludibacteraceae bacterium]